MQCLKVILKTILCSFLMLLMTGICNASVNKNILIIERGIFDSYNYIYYDGVIFDIDELVENQKKIDTILINLENELINRGKELNEVALMIIIYEFRIISHCNIFTISALCKNISHPDILGYDVACSDMMKDYNKFRKFVIPTIKKSLQAISNNCIQYINDQKILDLCSKGILRTGKMYKLFERAFKKFKK